MKDTKVLHLDTDIDSKKSEPDYKNLWKKRGGQLSNEIMCTYLVDGELWVRRNQYTSVCCKALQSVSK